MVKEDEEDRPGRTARLVMRRQGTAALATLAGGKDGGPHASMVTVALDQAGSPLLLLSKLAEHTSNIEGDSRVSLLFYDPPEPGKDPLTGVRVSVIGRVRATDQPDHRQRFLARHPEAVGYADFADFSFYRVEVERVHLVAGFGQICWLDGSDVILASDTASAFADAESGIVEHMNSDHRDAASLYANGLLGMPQGQWRVAACDPDGLDLGDGATGVYARLDFDPLVQNPEGIRAVLVNFVKRAKGL